MDRETRNRIQRATQAARELLEHEYAEQIEGEFDIRLDGTIAAEPGEHLDAAQRVLRTKLVAAVEHHQGTGVSGKQAVGAYLREAAFTVFNRFAALKMLEARGLVQQCVSRGDQSSGFKEFTGLAPGLIQLPDHGYRLYIECLFDEIGLEVGVLFDRRDLAGLLWPRGPALTGLLEILNSSALSNLWAEDETIGWVYQYWNSKEERKAMRDASGAPRNSRELAVRNQFFTPRYVVEFLTDNTLGRIWYEMTKGQTRLAETCRYLVRRPTEIFLAEDEAAPDLPDDSTEEPLSQEELLKQPVYIPHRPVKDPREIRLLDPACGSMHFGLYAFDLFEAIYEEAWDKDLCPALKEAYPEKADYLRDVPRLIIELNIHGVDIDPRAVQIAGLSLWLRAQKTWKGMPAGERPRIRRSNVVCAEPMPGNAAMLDDFVQTLDPPLLGELVKTVFDKMQLAGEAGTLLKIEEEIRAAIDQARKEALRQRGDLYEHANATEEAFFDTAEERIYTALEKYAESAEAGDYQRRLFAEDAAHGFAFIDLCRKRYDAVVMNPPFGGWTNALKAISKQIYPSSHHDILHAFVERGIACLMPKGRAGIISARTGFFLGDSKDWRRNVVFPNQLACFADLGLGVLDDALVEVAAYAIERIRPTGRDRALISRNLTSREKSSDLLHDIQLAFAGKPGGLLLFDQGLLEIVPDSTFIYWAPGTFIKRYASLASFESEVARVRQGVATADDFRFARLGWEVGSDAIGTGKRWRRFSKGGEYSPPYDEIHLLVNWRNAASEIWSNLNAQGNVRSNIWMLRQTIGSFFFKPGATYTVRTASAFAPKILPEGCVFSHNAQSWFTDSESRTLLSIAYLHCRVPQTYLEMAVGSGDMATSGSAARRYTTAVVHSVPSEIINHIDSPENLDRIKRLFHFKVREFSADETSCHFSLDRPRSGSLRDSVGQRFNEFMAHASGALEASSRLDESVTNAFQLTSEEEDFVDREVGKHPASYLGSGAEAEVGELWQLRDEELIRRAVEAFGAKRWFTKKSYFVHRKIEIICHYLEASPSTVIAQLLKPASQTSTVLGNAATVHVSECIGSLLGRWDIRYATGERQSPELPEPFDPLPVCPPGMLQNTDGLPAAQEDVPDDYPLRITWPGILVDDEGHSEDIIARVRDALAVIWGDRSGAIEQEACEILGASTLRDYFQKAFFVDHIKRYSKSRRKAPIYWQLGTVSGSYSTWLYYHRFTSDTLFRLLNDYIKPKVQHEERKLTSLTQDVGPNQTASQRKELAAQEAFVGELRAFCSEVARVAPLWNPDLNDGVIINFAPLWRLVPQNRAWQNECKSTWDKLWKGDYDWAHLAMHLWPERVVPKCAQDRSLAIAHGLEEIFWSEDAEGKWQPRNVEQTDIDKIIQERTSAAVKEALKSLLDAPTPGTGRATRKKAKRTKVSRRRVD
ncbi:MAG: BREX-1 system adenine-specific DNA-methyltransferase PglX [Planctomycetales bacterium]|nr:BREX-1 system adenine-specific DNA-methyltransferase PglX [Planctomycetales bacterium]